MTVWSTFAGALSLFRLAFSASLSTMVADQDDLKRRTDGYMLQKDYHQSIQGEDGEEPIEAIRPPAHTDMDSYYYPGPPTDLAKTREVSPGVRPLHYHAKSPHGVHTYPQQREQSKHIQPTCRVLIPQGEPMVLLTVWQNCWPNCYLDQKIGTRQPCLRL